MHGKRFWLTATALLLFAGSGCCHSLCERWCGNRPATVTPVAVAPATTYAAPACVPCQPVCCQPCCPVGSSPAPVAAGAPAPNGWQRGPYGP